MTMSKKNILVLGGLFIGGIGVASMMAEADGGDAPLEQIREKAGKILGSGGETTTTTTITEAKKDALVTEQPPVIFGAFPTDEDVFGQEPIVETQDKPSARRGGGGLTSSQRIAYDIMTATAMGGGVYKPPTKKDEISRSILPIAPAGVAAKGAVQEAAGVEAQRISRAGVAGGGAISAFLSDVAGVFSPSKIGSAGVAGGRAISGAISGVTGISKKYDYRGSGMTQSEYKSQFAERTYGTSPTGQAITPKKPSSYVRRSEIGYTYLPSGECVTKASVSSKKEIKTSGGD